MKIVSLPPKKSPFFLPFFLLLPLVFSLTAGLQIAYSQTTQLSLVDIIAVLRSKKVTIEERNQLLTEGVKTRGITFALNPDLEKELRTAGATNELIEAIRQKSPVVKVAAPEKKPDPVPVSTPKPPDYNYYQNRANSKFVLGEYEAAIVDYNKAIELNAKEPTIYFSRALAHYNQKNYNSAIADYDKAIELDPSESMAYFNRANALEKVGNFEKAVLDYQKAVELDADNQPAKNSLARLQADLAKLKPPTQNTPNTTPGNASTNKETASTSTPVDLSQPVNLGSLKSLAIKLVVPVYPAIERQRNTEGLVVVEVALDEEGEVISAKATSGPKSLRMYSEDAARKSRFKPAMVDNKPVKAIGFINYNFKVN